MKNRRSVYLISVLLLVALLCALMPAAYAEGTASVCTCSSAREKDPACVCGCNGTPAPSRETLLEEFLTYIQVAEQERDPVVRAQVYADAETLWDSFLDMTYAELDAEIASSAEPQITRAEVFEAFLNTTADAETERDPARRAELYRQAGELWELYLEMSSATDPYAAEANEAGTVGIIGGSDGPTAIFVTEDKDDDTDKKEVYLDADEYWDALLDLFFGSYTPAQPKEDSSTHEPAWMKPNRPGNSHGRPPRPEAAFAAPEQDIEEADKPEPFFNEPDEFLSDAFFDEVFNAFEDIPVIGLPNPWTETDFAEEAIRISGVELKLPEEESLPQNMKLLWFRALPGTIEADYSNGEEELMIRASVEDEGYILSGDYNSYSKEWNETVNGITVDCLGDGERINIAMFKTGDTAYALTMACGREGYGLTSEELAALMAAMQVQPAQEAEAADIYADPVDIYADEVDVYADPKPVLPVVEADPNAGKNGEIMILFTGDVHSAVDEGFGYAGLKALRDSMEAKGYSTILADNGNAVAGGELGTVSRGEAIIDLMNALDYDVAVPGEHEFDYGMEQFAKLAGIAEFPYISCDVTEKDGFALKPYVIIESAGKRIAIVGVTALDIALNEDAEAVYDAVQNAVDSARAEGADLVIVMGNLDSESSACEELAANLTGVDAFVDGHGDDNHAALTGRDGLDIPSVTSGAKLSNVGYVRISADGQLAATGVWSWTNDNSAALLFDLDNDITEMVQAAKDKLSEELNTSEPAEEAALTEDETADAAAEPETEQIVPAETAGPALETVPETEPETAEPAPVSTPTAEPKPADKTPEHDPRPDPEVQLITLEDFLQRFFNNQR